MAVSDTLLTVGAVGLGAGATYWLTQQDGSDQGEPPELPSELPEWVKAGINDPESKTVNDLPTPSPSEDPRRAATREEDQVTDEEDDTTVTMASPSGPQQVTQTERELLAGSGPTSGNDPTSTSGGGGSSGSSGGGTDPDEKNNDPESDLGGHSSDTSKLSERSQNSNMDQSTKEAFARLVED
jgi:hypothetical protein